MTVPPFTEDPQQARPYFRKLRELCDQIEARRLPAVGMDTLSMGMSHDFEVAIEEGATCVRVGTAIFGERSSKVINHRVTETQNETRRRQYEPQRSSLDSVCRSSP